MKLYFLKNTTFIVFFSLLPILSWGQYKNLKQATALNPSSIEKATQPIDYPQKLKINPKAAAIIEKYKKPQKALPTEELNFSGPSFDLSTLSVASARKKAISNRKIEVIKDESGLPIFITGKRGYRLHEFSQNSRDKIELEKEVFNFLDSYKQELKITAPKQEFRIKETITDDNGNQHFRMDQVYEGIPVYGKQLIVHIAEDGVYALNGRYVASPKKVINQQNITAEEAMVIIEKDLGKKRHTLSEKLKKYVNDYDPPTLIFYSNPVEQSFQLAWQVEFHAKNMKHWSFIIDAKDGSILQKVHSSCGFTGPTTAVAQDLHGTNQVINTWDNDDIFVLIDASRPMFNSNTFNGRIGTLDAKFAFEEAESYNFITSTNNTWTDAGAVSAHFNAGISYEYFRQTFNRNSIDGLGGNVFSVVNYAEEGDADNAFYNGKFLIYAKGKNAFQPVSLAKSLDVVAHEFSHGVVRNSAGLEYKFQSGALNESFADVFGVMVDRDDWQVGEEVVRPDVYLSGAMRDIANPNNGGNIGDNGWQPANMSEYLNWEFDRDNGGVHYNSGIPNRAFYLFATDVGKEKAEQVYYKALTQYLTKTSQFIDCRLAVIQSAQDLYGTAEVAAATAAFDAVGIFGEDGTSTQEDLPAVVGDEFVLTQVSTDNGAVIGEIEMSTGDYTIKSSTDFNPRLSVEEDGSIAYFIGTDQKAYIIDLNNPDANNNFELLFSTDSELRFHQIAISRDGRRIAFLSSPRTPNIVFFDFDNGSFNQFPITNPNTGTGTVESAPDFLDVIQFDPTGQYIMYDAYNSIDESAGYWDIGFLRVWDNGTNSLGNGQIAKPFTAIPPGISVGNPVFSNTSFNRIAFEFFNFDDENALVITQDLNSGDFAIVAENKFYDDFSLLGRPYFSPNDQFIAYVTDKEEEANYVTFQALGDDKLTPQGEPFGGYFGESPIWYSKGTRAFLPPAAEFKANITEGPATLTVNFREESTNSPLAWNWTFEGGTPNTSTERNPIVSYSTPGIYDVKLTVTNDAGANTKTRNGYIIVGADNNNTTSLSLSLQEGWNMVSLNLHPDAPDINEVLGPIINNVTLIKNSVGTSAIPSLGINQIGNWNVLEGYQIKVNNPISLTLSGERINTAQSSIPIKTGWQIIPYLGNNSSNINTALSSIISDIAIVKTNLGNSFIPDLGINQIGDLEPSQGYWLKATRNTTLRFPSNLISEFATSRTEITIPKHFQLNTLNAGNNATLVIPNAASNDHFQLNDEIGIFTPEGLLCGAGVYTGDNMAITIWGDDLTTEQKEGLSIGDNFTIKQWNEVNQLEQRLQITIQEGAERYEVNGITLVNSFESSNIVQELDGINIYPNPTKTAFTVALDEPLLSQGTLQIYSLTGQLIFEEVFPAGQSKHLVQLPHQESGVYLVEVKAGEKVYQRVKLLTY